MRGNRRTKNTFVAVKSRSLTESDGWRIPAANPRFLPTTAAPELAASFSVPLPTLDPTRVPHRRAGIRGNPVMVGETRAPGAPPAPLPRR